MSSTSENSPELAIQGWLYDARLNWKLLVQFERTNWTAVEVWYRIHAEACQRALHARQEQPLSDELSDQICRVCSLYNSNYQYNDKFINDFGNFMLINGIHAQQATAVIAYIFFNMSLYLKKPLDERNSKDFMPLQGVLRTLLQAMSNLRYQVVCGYDDCPIYKNDEERTHFAAWMRSARKAVQLGGHAGNVVQLCEQSITDGFGSALAAEICSSTQV